MGVVFTSGKVAVGIIGGEAVAGGGSEASMVERSSVAVPGWALSCVEDGSGGEAPRPLEEAGGGVALAKFTPPGAMKSGAPESRGVRAQAQLNPARSKAMRKGRNSLAFDLILGAAAFPGLD
jgi:hypothetical protein